jgi:chromate transporter
MPSPAPSRARVGEVGRVFLQLGFTAFGGPAAHIAAMEDELVRVRRWVKREEFIDLISATNLIPGPNSTELAIHLGYRRAGWIGLIVAGLAFIAPAVAIVWLLAMGYVKYGPRPEVSAILTGMQPVVLAVIVQALWRLGRTALRSPSTWAVAAAALAAVFAGVHEWLVLVFAAMVTLVDRDTETGSDSARSNRVIAFVGAAGGATAVVASLPTTAAVFAAFLKIGSMVFGSGYVLVAFLRSAFVTQHGWITEAQLLDAIAIGQATPGPVFTAATFIGFLLGGHAGAGAATLGIFLPAFVLVALSGPLLRRVRGSRRAAKALDGVNAASLALMAGAVLQLARPLLTSPSQVGIFVVAAVTLLGTRIGSGWMLLAGAALGFLRTFTD